MSTEYLSPFIPDGYTLTATIPAVEKRWSEIKIRYRPMSPDEEAEVFAQMRLFPAEPSTKFYAPIMAQKLLGWDVKDHGGKPVEITEDVLRNRISPQLYDVLKQYIDGTMCGDQEKNS